MRSEVDLGGLRGTVSVLGLVIAAFLVGCDRPGATGAGKKLVVVISGDTAGWLMPCGCTSNQSGGLLRRATYVNGLRATSDVILADAGGAAGGDSEYHKVKFEAILAGERQMGIAAHNIGRSEAAFGPAYLRDVSKRTSAPLISANVRDAGG